jgi:hypothetical protein
MRRGAWLSHVLAAAFAAASIVGAQSPAWRTWSAKEAQTVGESMSAAGRVGKRATLRLLKTERAISYKLRATWLTPEVIFASARLAQLRSRLTEAQAMTLVEEARAAGDTVVIVDIDPDEGSGVIPLEWEAFLQPKGKPERAVSGVRAPDLRKLPALQGVTRRNYDYDRFWVVFPLKEHDGRPLFGASDSEAELIVRIYDREGRVTWRVPSSTREM